MTATQKVFSFVWVGSTLVVSLVCAAPNPGTAAFEGMIAPYHEIELAARSDGVVSRVLVEEGEAITEDQLLARLEDVKEGLEVEYQKQLVDKRASDLQVAQELLEEDIASRDEFEQKQVDWKLADTQYRLAQQRLEEKTFKSPINGFVVRIYKELGESIQHLEPFAKLMQLDKVHAVLYLDQEYLAAVQRNQSAEIRVPAVGSRVFAGRVEVVDPVIDPASGLFRVKVVIENPDLVLRPGSPATVSFMPAKDTNP